MNRVSLVSQLEDHYIFTQTSGWRLVENGIVKVYKPVYHNDTWIITGATVLEIDLLKHFSKSELKVLLLRSLNQDEFEVYWQRELQEYEKVEGGYA